MNLEFAEHLLRHNSPFGANRRSLCSRLHCSLVRRQLLFLCLLLGALLLTGAVYFWDGGPQTGLGPKDYVDSLRLVRCPADSVGSAEDVDVWDRCNDENMVYRVHFALPTDPAGTCRVWKGRKFECAHKWVLDRFNLSDRHRISGKIPIQRVGAGAVFVVAANREFFPYLRTVLDSIKRAFGRQQRIIGYDLGGISGDRAMMSELEHVCELDWRLFDFSMLPSGVRSVKTFSWKILIIAVSAPSPCPDNVVPSEEVLTEYPTLIYADTAFQFNWNGFDRFFDLMQRGRISEWQTPSNAGHNISSAIHPAMYAYLPYFARAAEPNRSIEMQEAGFDIVHRSEYTRQLLKWATLCAMTSECIDPFGAKLYCPWWWHLLGNGLLWHCYKHRQDQSAINILNRNLEQRSARTDANFIRREDPRNPRPRSNSRSNFFHRDRYEPLAKNREEFAKTVRC